MNIHIGDKKLLRWDNGPISFGMILNHSIVNWSDEKAQDLLISRCWQGLYLYPSYNLSDEELSKEPIEVFQGLGDIFAIPCDWNRDGISDVIAANRYSFIHKLLRQGEYPNIKFEYQGFLRDRETQLPFNIPFENPHNPKLDNLGGYIDRAFFNYVYPCIYPRSPQNLDMIIGDMAGFLWWLPDESDGTGEPEYSGVIYEKDKDDIATNTGKDFIKEHGWRYAKPKHLIKDIHGEPLLLGEGSEKGTSYPGGNAKPIAYYSSNGSMDIIVETGFLNCKFYYLKAHGFDEDGVPVFENLGEINVENEANLPQNLSCFHTTLSLISSKNEVLLISNNFNLLRAEIRNDQSSTPKFIVRDFIKSPDAIAGCSNICAIYKHKDKRFCIETTGSTFLLREIKNIDGNIKLAFEGFTIQDNNRDFTLEGETDPQGGKEWGWHRLAGWNYDGLSKDNFIVGTDKGLLYLLIKNPTDNPSDFHSQGPLKDEKGNIIKIHNRATAAGIDVFGSGREDLIVGGVSYQLGIPGDPRPGTGIYLIRNMGLNSQGLPILSEPKLIDIEGFEYSKEVVNLHVFIQTIDLNNDGAMEVLINIQKEAPNKFLICKFEADGNLKYTGNDIFVEHSIEEWLLDYDDDGTVELLYTGMETGVGYWKKLTITE